MANSTTKYRAPLREKTEEELVLAITREHSDASACRAVLRNRDGWTDAQIDRAAATWFPMARVA